MDASWDLPGVYDDSLVADVLFPIKSGKEATVYCCRAEPHVGPDLLAAKVYKPLQSRSFKNDAIYQEGRYIRDARMRRAYRKKSKAGRSVQFSGWITAEFEALKELHDAGADVPLPLSQARSTIVMEYVGTEDTPAPPLSKVHLPQVSAPAIFRRLMWNVDLFLSVNRVHGDLSAFNVLVWDNEIRIIDLPQCVLADMNPNAFDLLVRDLTNVGDYFVKYDIDTDPVGTAISLWEAHMNRQPVSS
jgi:RIO kinase 1